MMMITEQLAVTKITIYKISHHDLYTTVMQPNYTLNSDFL